jgi:hypothetical protein
MPPREQLLTDPRVYFAAERTLLAWLRTGIAIMAFGFVVARFSLIVRLLDAQGSNILTHHGVSPYLGAYPAAPGGDRGGRRDSSHLGAAPLKDRRWLSCSPSPARTMPWKSRRFDVPPPTSSPGNSAGANGPPRPPTGAC